MKRDTNVNLNNPRVHIEGGIIASVYVVLALVFAPISFGPIQLRIAEALTALPLRRGSAVSGLFVGCFIANSLGPNGMMDAVIGSVLTLIAAVITYYLREKNFFVAMLAPVLINAVVYLCRYAESSPDNGIYSGGTDIGVHGTWIPFYKGIR